MCNKSLRRRQAIVTEELNSAPKKIAISDLRKLKSIVTKPSQTYSCLCLSHLLLFFTVRLSHCWTGLSPTSTPSAQWRTGWRPLRCRSTETTSWTPASPPSSWSLKWPPSESLTWYNNGTSALHIRADQKMTAFSDRQATELSFSGKKGFSQSSWESMVTGKSSSPLETAIFKSKAGFLLFSEFSHCT